MSREFSHYFRSVEHIDEVDIYRLLLLFGVTDPCLAHAIKKLIAAGGRGTKSFETDVRESVKTLQRRLEILEEDRALTSTAVDEVPSPAFSTLLDVFRKEREAWDREEREQQLKQIGGWNRPVSDSEEPQNGQAPSIGQSRVVGGIGLDTGLNHQSYRELYGAGGQLERNTGV